SSRSRRVTAPCRSPSPTRVPASPTRSSTASSVPSGRATAAEPDWGSRSRVSSPSRSAGSSAVTYTGTWYTNSGSFNSGGSSVLAIDKGSRATFTFTGTALKWIGYRDQWSGIANVYVDGVLKAQVDTYSATGQAQAVNYTIT